MPLNTNQTILQKVKVDAWLRTHGKIVRPELTKQQKQELKECFELIDADGSGAIDAGELVTAFNVLGLRVRKSEIEQMLAEVDADGSGEVEYPEFVQIMTSKLDSETREGDLAKEKPRKQALPFQLLAQAYRRKKLMEAVMGGDKAAQERLTAKAEEAEVERQAVLAAMEEENQNPAVQYDQKKMRTISDLNYERIRRDQIRRKLQTDSIVNLDDEMKMIITESFKSGSYEDPRHNIGEKHGNRDDSRREMHEHNKIHHWLKTELADLNEYRSRVHHKPVLEKQLLHLRAIKSIHDNAHN